MMRPGGLSSCPRITALEARNTALRLVSMTASHFVVLHPHGERLSRVMPALLTKMPTAPNSFSIVAMAASTGPRRAPRGPKPAPGRLPPQDRPKPFRAVFTGRGTDRRALGGPVRGAMARPMPRVAPVTKAIVPFSMASPGRGWFDAGRIRAGNAVDAFGATLGESGEHLPGPHSATVVTP